MMSVNRRVAEIAVHAAPNEAQRQLAGNGQHEVAVARWCAPEATVVVVAHHESAHVWPALRSGWCAS